MTRQTEKLMILNAQRGGYKSYESTPDQKPEREDEIQEFIKDQHEQGIGTVVVSDSYLWDERYGNASGIAAHFGFEGALHTRIDDTYLNKIGRAGIGLTILTDHEIVDPEIARVGSEEHARNALVVELQTRLGKMALGAAYLPEDNAFARLPQAQGVYEAISERRSSKEIIAGDMNTLRPHRNYNNLRQRSASRAIQIGATAARAGRIFGKKGRYVSDTLAALNNRDVPEFLESKGFVDLDAGPTYYPPRIEEPVLDPDHIFYRGVDVVKSYTDGKRATSDHRAVIAEFGSSPLDK